MPGEALQRWAAGIAVPFELSGSTSLHSGLVLCQAWRGLGRAFRGHCPVPRRSCWGAGPTGPEAQNSKMNHCGCRECSQKLLLRCRQQPLGLRRALFLASPMCQGGHPFYQVCQRSSEIKGRSTSAGCGRTRSPLGQRADRSGEVVSELHKNEFSESRRARGNGKRGFRFAYIAPLAKASTLVHTPGLHSRDKGSRWCETIIYQHCHSWRINF